MRQEEYGIGGRRQGEGESECICGCVCVFVRETERRARKWEGTNEKGKEKIINIGREVNMGDINNSGLLDIAFKFPGSWKGVEQD